LSLLSPQGHVQELSIVQETSNNARWRSTVYDTWLGYCKLLFLGHFRPPILRGASNTRQT